MYLCPHPLQCACFAWCPQAHKNTIAIFCHSYFGAWILGTYTGIPVQGALANSRIVGVFVGGLIGGTVVGVASALLAGIHRWAIDIGGFTSLACMLSTIVEGCLAAVLHRYFLKSKQKWLFGMVS